MSVVTNTLYWYFGGGGRRSVRMNRPEIYKVFIMECIINCQ